MLPLKDENPTSTTPFVTFAIIALCALVFFGPQSGASDPEEALRFNLEYAAIPCEIFTGEALSVEEVEDTFSGGNATACQDGEASPGFFPEKNPFLGALTSIFLHGGIMHLLGNMWSLWIFGNNIEDRLGHVKYIAFYLIGGVVATLAHYLVQPSSTIPVVGASGAIAAIMGAYLVWFPNAPIRTIVFFFLRDITAKWFLGIWFVMQFFTGANSGVAWMAHVGGFVFGALVALAVRGSGVGSKRINRSPDQTTWDTTGGAGHGPLPHPFEDRRSRDTLGY